MMPSIHPLMAALIISYTQGQKESQKISSEKREKDRLFHQKNMIFQQCVSDAESVGTAKKGIMA